MDSSGGIIPAYAGSTLGDWLADAGLADHPRIRGEHEKPRHEEELVPGSSPHTRGAPTKSEVRSSGGRIIPAYAGSTKETPRKFTPGGGSSPHTRGARARADGIHGRQGIIPAYAGSTLMK